MDSRLRQYKAVFSLDISFPSLSFPDTFLKESQKKWPYKNFKIIYPKKHERDCMRGDKD